MVFDFWTRVQISPPPNKSLQRLIFKRWRLFCFSETPLSKVWESPIADKPYTKLLIEIRFYMCIGTANVAKNEYSHEQMMEFCTAIATKLAGV